MNVTDPYTLSIEEDVLNLKVQSSELRRVYAASRTNEDLAEAVVSAHIITAEEIRQSGALTLVELLRLAPGVLVKQKTNGYYEVSIRGNSGTANQQPAAAENASVLVAIDGIPVNNWLSGAVWWESLPIDRNDIQQIEIIASPHSVFFGPNAASGVINFVSKSVEEKILHANASLQGSINQDYVHRGSARFGTSDQLKFRVSGHYQRLTRFQDEFYLLNERRYVRSDSLLHYQSTAPQTNVSAEKALRNTGINATAFFQPSPKVTIEAMLGANESDLQSVLEPLDRVAMTNRESKTSTVALRAQTGNFRTSVAYQSGTHNLAVGYPGFETRTGNLYAATEYDYSGQFYQLKLGGTINYNSFKNELPTSTINFLADAPYAHRLLLGTNSFTQAGVLISQNVRLLNKKWRWTAAVRGDHLSLTGRLHGSYQLGTTYQVGKVHLIRANASRGWGNLSAQNYLFYDDATRNYQANSSLKPLRNQTYEVGYRITPYSDLSLGATYFRSKLSNRTQLSTAALSKPENSRGASLQQGFTADVRWSLNKLRTTAFVTVQRSQAELDAVKSADPSVPRYFGGVSGSYRTFLNKLRFSTSVYFYDKSTLANGGEVYQLPRKLLANAKISYNVWDEHTLFLNARNMFGNRKIESPYADRTNSLYLIGIDLVF